MIKAFDLYSLVTGGHGMRGSIWQGADHLLIVEGKGFLLPLSEHYRRIDYQNIQALTFVRTSRFAWYVVMLSVITALLGWGFYAALDEQIGILLLSGLPFTLMLVLLVLHLIRGPTCRCTLQTAVLSLRLRPLTRLRKTTAVISSIEKLCLEHQQAIPQDLSEAELPQQQPAFTPAGLKPAWPGSRWILTTGVATVLWGGALAGELFVPGTAYSVVNMVVGVVAYLLLIISLVRTYRYQAPGGLLPVLWISLILQNIVWIGGYIALVAISAIQGIRQSENGASPNFEPHAIFEKLAELSFVETGDAGWIVVSFGVIMLALGVSLIPYSFRPKGFVGSSQSTPPSHTLLS